MSKTTTKVFSPKGVYDWLTAQALFVPEAAVALEWLTPNRPQAPKPYLLRARVAGDTLRDLIEALQQLDPDLKHGVEEVSRGDGRIDGLGIEPEKYARLEQASEDEANLLWTYENALTEIRDADQCSVQDLQNLAREALQ